MTSSSERPGASRPFPNVPPPQGTRPTAQYSRFIPREELGACEPWVPGAFGSDRRLRPRTVEQPEFSNEQWHAQIAQARAQATARGREEGLREGRQAGYEQGYRDGISALEGFKASFAQQTSARIGDLLRELDEQLAQIEPVMAQTLSRCALMLARQVLRDELRSHPEHVSQVAREAVNAIAMSARQIVVHVHPEDLPLVAQGAEEALKARGARLQADAGLHRGGCRIESDAGSIDASIESRWARACAGIGQELAYADEAHEAHEVPPAPRASQAPETPRSPKSPESPKPPTGPQRE